MRLTHGLFALALLSVGGCATEPRQTPPEPGGPPPGAGPPMLFISPSGEPFRGPPGAPYPVVDWFARADANHDGRLDRSEFVADAMRFFAALDRNHDEVIDGPEVRYYETVIAPEILRGPQFGAAGGLRLQAAYQGGGGGMGGMGGMGGGMGPPPGGGRGRPPGGGAPGRGQSLAGAAPYGLLREPQPVAAAGLSIGGRITPTDFRRRATERFDWLDRDRKGFLELATLPRTAVQDMAAGGGRRRRPA
ncbi:hypothetical protein [Phenylobacterium sp.]|uniref:hypothetical protein n=1 Tax=Phenylobacterium sp. TaxID=1871053 RepID=UPI0026014945|nr:hypothetical protein [Phenylobacterium sp.]